MKFHIIGLLGQKYKKKYFLLNVGLVAPKMQVTLNHEYFEPEVCTHTKLSNLKGIE